MNKDNEYEYIPFTDEHIEKIREGDKITTMRTVKKDNTYKTGQKYRVDKEEDLYIKMARREIIKFGPQKAEAFDNNAEIFSGTPAKHDALREVEGFDSIGDMINWFENRGYNLPQPFFLYIFEAVETREGDEE